MDITLSSQKYMLATQKNQKSEMGNIAVNESLTSCRFKRNRRSRRKRRDMKKEKIKNLLSGCREETNDDDDDDNEEEEEEEEEKAEVERKIVALQRIVPGGESLGVDKLFEETAEYILALQHQIKAMRVLASFVEEKKKNKFGVN